MTLVSSSATLNELREAGTPATFGPRIAALAVNTDVRVRVLCARHPNLPDSHLAELAADPEPAVRAALACRRGLPATVVSALIVDDDRRVRRAAARHQVLMADDVLRLIEADAWSPTIERLVRERLDDPEFTAAMFAHPRWRRVAAAGVFAPAAVRRWAKSDDEWAALLIAQRAVLKGRSMVRLSRSRSVDVQEAIGGRAGLTGGTAWCVACCGREHAAAAVVRVSRSRAVRVLTVVRPSRCIAVARVQATTSRFRLWRSTFSGRFVTGLAAAANPHTGRRARQRLMKKMWWAYHFQLARREDLSPSEYARLDGHPSVALRLAANPAIPIEVVRTLQSSDDPFVSHLAQIHRSLPLEQRLAVAADPAAPAWLLRRLAHDPAVPVDEADRLLVWLALGGGEGDAHFDPIACSGMPGAIGGSRDEAYRRQSPDAPLESPLWYTRRLVARGTLAHETVGLLAADGHEAVRLAAAAYSSPTAVRLLRCDIDPRVRAQAATTIDGLPTSGRWSPRLATARAVVARVAAGAGVIVLALHFQGGGRNPTLANNASAAPRWESAFPVPSVPPTCAAGGVFVWVDRAGESFVVTMESLRSSEVVDFVIADASGTEVERAHHVVGEGEFDAMTYTVPKGRGHTLVVMIGDRPDSAIIVPGILDLPVVVRDGEGDC